MKIFYIIIFLITIVGEGAMAQNQIVRKDLLTAKMESRTISKVNVMEINFPPGQKAAYHKHPCPVVGYIVSGKILLQVEDDSSKVLNSGDAFYEPAETPIVRFDNYSDSEPAKFIAYYLVDKEKELIEILPQK